MLVVSRPSHFASGGARGVDPLLGDLDKQRLEQKGVFRGLGFRVLGFGIEGLGSGV